MTADESLPVAPGARFDSMPPLTTTAMVCTAILEALTAS